MKINRLPSAVSEGLAAGATLVVASAQRQAAVRAAWAGEQRASGRKLWSTPRVLTFTQFAESRLAQQWADRNLPDRLLAPAAEWALMRQMRRESGGIGEARALLASIRTLRDWRIPRSPAALAGAPEGDLLLETLAELAQRSREVDRHPLVHWLDQLETVPGTTLLGNGLSGLPTAQAETLRRLGARDAGADAAPAPVAVATVQDDEHEIEMIAGWCRAHLEQRPQSRLLIVDARLRQRRRQYERALSQTLAPSEWISNRARAFSTSFSIEGGQPLTDFPLIAHALLSLRLLTGNLRFDELLLWLRMPFLDHADLFAGAAIEAELREGHRLEYSGDSLAGFLERASSEPARLLAVRLRQALAQLGDGRRSAPEWAPRLLAALRTLGWHGSRALRTDEQQTAMRWYALLDEYSALGLWLPRGSGADAVAALLDLAHERSFDPASVAAPVTLTDSHDDPVVRYDGIWIAGLDAAQWPPAPRPDAFIPLRLQVAARIPAASAAGQSERARASLEAWRRATDALVCSWAQLDADAHRTPSPLLWRLSGRTEYAFTGAAASLAARLHVPQLESIDDSHGTPVNIAEIVRGGVRPIELQAECGFHAYGQIRLDAERLEEPAPGIDLRTRGRILHKSLELLWQKLQNRFRLEGTDEQVRKPTIHQAVVAAVNFVFPRTVPAELEPSVNRESMRIERLIEQLLKLELSRPSFDVDRLEARREVNIAGGTFVLRIDRIDVLEGGGAAILDYKSGASRAPRWDAERLRDPQLLAYLLAERGRDVQALANVSLTRGRARFIGKASTRGLLPGVTGFSPAKVPHAEIQAAWQGNLEYWLQSLQSLAARYLAGEAPVQPASDVCRHCHLTVLCRRVELEAADTSAADEA